MGTLARHRAQMKAQLKYKSKHAVINALIESSPSLYDFLESADSAPGAHLADFADWVGKPCADWIVALNASLAALPCRGPWVDLWRDPTFAAWRQAVEDAPGFAGEVQPPPEVCAALADEEEAAFFSFPPAPAPAPAVFGAVFDAPRPAPAGRPCRAGGAHTGCACMPRRESIAPYIS